MSMVSVAFRISARLARVVGSAYLVIAPAAMHAQTARGDSAAVVDVVTQFHASLAGGDSARAVSVLAEDLVVLEAGSAETYAEYLGHHLAADMKASKTSAGARTVTRVTVMGNAAFLEALAYGMAFGATPAGLLDALEKSNASRINFDSIVKKIINKGGENISLSFNELPGYVAAESGAASLPLTSALIGFLKSAPPTVIEGGMHVPCLWTELTRKQKKN